MSNTLPIDQLMLACTYWLQQKIQSNVIPFANTNLRALYTSGTPALFETDVLPGEPTSTEAPRFFVWSEAGSQPRQAEAQGLSPQSRISVMYKIRIVLPEVSTANTISDFELSKQCGMGALEAFLFDTRQTMQPSVYTKADPDNQITALAPCRPGEWRSIFMKPLADKTTLPRAAEISYTFQFLIQNNLVISAL